MENLMVIEHQQQRVLTTAQVAQGYETEIQVITNNFNRNKDRYTENIHYIKLLGDDKKDFIGKNQIEFSPLNTQPIYLWTEKGTFLHAKSLNTDKAWDVYNELVDTYFRVKKMDIEEVYKQYNLPLNYTDALKHLLVAVEEKEILQQENNILKPKAEKFDEFLKANNAQTMLEISKVLSIGRGDLMKFLRIKKVFMSNNLPYEKYCGRNLFVSREFTIKKKSGIIINCCQTYALSKGIDWIAELIKEEIGGLLFRNETTNKIKLVK